MIQTLSTRLSAMLGGGAGIGCADVTGPEGLWPEEVPAMARATPKRQAEFAAGRRAARAALASLNHPACAIPVGDRRAPVWPENIVGAITHDKGLALAAVLPGSSTLGVGIDLTEAATLPDDTRRDILPHAAEAHLNNLEARAGFSAKESLFKALFPTIRDYFGFKAASVTVDLSTKCFELTLLKDLGPFPAKTVWQGRVVVHGEVLMTALRIDSE